ncbi:MAG TPA: hypothetical protein PLB62_05735, partial [Candidatus Sumerlaeota bacterium]|nr:hypothetical protein [Candidatus Sumerlaeota bacterium]
HKRCGRDMCVLCPELFHPPTRLTRKISWFNTTSSIITDSSLLMAMVAPRQDLFYPLVKKSPPEMEGQ